MTDAPGLRSLLLDLELGTDAGQAWALVWAARSPVFALAAVTCVGREGRLRARMAAKLLALLQAGTVPVHAGAEVALSSGPGFRWLGHEPEAWLEPTEEPPIERLHAVDALRRALRAGAASEVVCLGPLTNVALAIALEPRLAAHIRCLTWVGEPERDRTPLERSRETAWLTASARYNAEVDPVARELVERAGVPIRRLELESDPRAWARGAAWERLAGEVVADGTGAGSVEEGIAAVRELLRQHSQLCGLVQRRMTPEGRARVAHADGEDRVGPDAPAHPSDPAGAIGPCVSLAGVLALAEAERAAATPPSSERIRDVALDPEQVGEELERRLQPCPGLRL